MLLLASILQIFIAQRCFIRKDLDIEDQFFIESYRIF